jgi:pSer/pThr/pTyr-binding forkhead associated (FHA) protein
VRSGGGRAGEQFPLERTQTTIGRTPDCDIFLDDVTVSRRHAIVAKGARTFTLEDLGSLNGTFLNRHRIEQADLENGDEVQIGTYRLIFLGR